LHKGNINHYPKPFTKIPDWKCWSGLPEETNKTVNRKGKNSKCNQQG